MFRKMLVILVVGSCLLGWNGSAFAYIGYFETVNLDGGGFDDVFSSDILETLRLEQEPGDSEEVWAWKNPPFITYDLYDEGTMGDIESGDGRFTKMFPSKGAKIGEEFNFWIGTVGGDSDKFNGNNLTPANVKSATDELVWDSVTGADSYWVGIWDTTHEFLDEDGYVDFSEKLKYFELDSSTTSINDFGLPGIPDGTEYTYGIFAMGDGTVGKDGWSATKGSLYATPEPVSSLLFLLGGISLIFCGKKNRRRIRVLT